MEKKPNIWILLISILLRIIIIPVAGVALNLWIIVKYQGWALTIPQIIYLSLIVRIAVYTMVRTVRIDWRD